MRKLFLFLWLGSVVLLSARADVVTLANGDRLSGTLGALTDGTLAVATDLAGDVTIPWANIAGIESAATVGLRGVDGTLHEGQLVYTDGSQFLKTSDGLEPIVLGQVQAIGASGDALAAEPAAEVAEAETPDMWSGVIDMGASWRTGTRSTLDARSTVTATREAPSNKLTLMLDAAYGEDENIANKQAIKGEAKWQLFPRERFYYYGLAGAEHDDIRNLKIRLNGAVGLGYEFVKNDVRTFSGDAGIDYAHERWERYSDSEKDARRDEVRAGALAQLEVAGRAIFGGVFEPSLGNLFITGQSIGLLYDPGVDNGIDIQNSLSLRLSSHYEQSLFEKAHIVNDLTLLPEIDAIGEMRLNNNLAFTTPLSEALSLKLAIKSEYDSDPGDNVSNWDHLFTTGVQYKF